MSKKIFALVILIMMLFVVSCDSGNTNGGNNNGGENNDGYITEDGEVIDRSSVEEKNGKGEFVFYGKVTENSDIHHIVVEIVDSKIAFGTYWVNVGDQTEYVGANGEKIVRKDIKVGDTIEIVFGGQTTMSLPPQISAQRITVK